MEGLQRGRAGSRGEGMSRRQVLRTSTYGIAAVLLAGSRLPGPSRSAASASTGSTGAAATPARAGAVTTFRRPAVARAATRLAGAAQPHSVCHGRNGTMIVGVADDGGPVSWRSVDGRRWDAARMPVPAVGDAEALGVAAHGSRFIAVGSVRQARSTAVVADSAATGVDANVTFAATRQLPALWWTADGVLWSSELIADVGAASAQLVAVSCHADRLVAVGGTLDDDGVQGAGGLVLISDDGVTWQQGEITGAELAEGWFTGVALTDSGWFATSSDMTGGTVWASPDGRRWSPVDGSRTFFTGMTLQGIGSRGRKVLVAATRVADNVTRYFVSHDGCRAWRALRPRARGFTRPDATVGDLSVVDGDLVVVGNRNGAPVVEGGIAHVGD